jgi:hypothetical protein
MAHDDHFHCYDHAGAGVLHTRSDTFKRGGAGSPDIQLYSLKKDLAALQARSGGRAVVSALGTTPGVHGGRDIMLVKIGTDFHLPKPRILFTGGLHAREWIGPTYTFLVAEWLVDNYAANPLAQDLVDNFHVWIVPMVNPDGHEYTVTTDRMWRKNSPPGDPDFRLSPTTAVVGRQAGAPESVDINRNFDSAQRAAVIATGRGSWSSDINDDTYLFDVVVDHHSFGCFILHSPGDDTRTLSTIDATAATRYATFGARMKSLLDTKSRSNPSMPGRTDTWTLQQAALFYHHLRSVPLPDSVVPGSIKDFAFYLPRPAAPHRTLCFTLELPPLHFRGSPGFELPERAIRAVFRTCLPNSLALIKCAQVASPTAAQYNAFSGVP